MVDQSTTVNVEKLISISDELVQFLDDDKDVSFLRGFSEQSKAFQSNCYSDYDTLQSSTQDYLAKINACKLKIKEAQTEAAADDETDKLQKELENELRKEELSREELRVIAEDINDLDRQRETIEDLKQLHNKIDQDQLRAELKLSLYASVTNIIPDLDDRSKISGHIVEKDKNLVGHFEFDPLKVSALDTCKNIWKMIN